MTTLLLGSFSSRGITATWGEPWKHSWFARQPAASYAVVARRHSQTLQLSSLLSPEAGISQITWPGIFQAPQWIPAAFSAPYSNFLTQSSPSTKSTCGFSHSIAQSRCLNRGFLGEVARNLMFIDWHWLLLRRIETEWLIFVEACDRYDPEARLGDVQESCSSVTIWWVAQVQVLRSGTHHLRCCLAAKLCCGWNLACHKFGRHGKRASRSQGYRLRLASQC